MKVAYIMSRFPHLPETFIIREMAALEKGGLEISLYPIIIQRESVVHPIARPWIRRINRSSLFSLSLWMANMRFAFSGFKGFRTLFKHVIDANIKNKKFLSRILIIFPKAVWMAEAMKREGVDIIHAHYATHPALAAYIVHQLTGIPYSISVHAHDIFVDQTMLCEKLVSAEFVRSISDFNKKFLIKICGSGIGTKIKTIHCGIDLNNYRATKGKRKENFRILSIGSLQPYKGYEYLLKACALLKMRNINFSCEIIGGGEQKSSLDKMVLELGIGENVHFLGRKNETEVADHLYHANVYVQPSIVTSSGKMEGIPVALMEAMASKLPVIATNISGIPELVEDQHNGFLVPANDEVALAERIFWVYENSEKAEKLGKNGRKKIKKEFDLNEITVQLKELFHKIMEKTAGDK